jgi:hypothetical protein
MRHLVLLVLFSAALVAGCQRKNARSGEKYSVALSAGRMVVNDKVVTGSAWPLKDLQEIFGKADRIYEGANTVHIYEDQGLLLFEVPKKGIVSEIQIFLAPPTERDTLTPKQVWPGTVALEELALTSEVVPAVLSRKLPTYNFKVSYTPTVYRGAYMGTYVFASFSKDYRRLEMLSFGLD